MYCRNFIHFCNAVCTKDIFAAYAVADPTPPAPMMPSLVVDFTLFIGSPPCLGVVDLSDMWAEARSVF